MGPECTESSTFCQKIRQWGLGFRTEMPCWTRNRTLRYDRSLNPGLKEGSTSCREAPLRHFLPYQAFHATTDFPEHNNKSKGAVCLAAPWSMAHGSRVMTLRSNSPMVPLATIALRSYSTRAQVQSCPISLGISPSPTLRINLACLGRKNQPDAKSHPVGWLSSFDGVGGGI